MTIQEEQNIGELVALDYRTAAVFKKYGIDFCCQGNRTINDACRANHLDKKLVISDLSTLFHSPSENTIDYASWPIDLLVDYIEKKHHRYVETKTQEIKPYIDKICKVHGDRHTELLKIKALFDTATGELAKHMKKEELVLFPFIRALAKAKLQHSTLVAAPFGTVQNPIQMMMHEHSVEGNRFREIEALSDTYTPPAEACSTYQVAFALLKEFEQDLHLHIHLENNILFPKALALEKQLS